ncbi:hypothetical protein FOA52_009273 [Chlamydomonas sp. UWO 241]|nr:hypothetical protein FOA52_009273 [Chlamydomonas sp. UWO 241]
MPKPPKPVAGQILVNVKPSILETTFPLWDAREPEPTSNEKYEDFAGLMLPPASEEFLDAWKRPEELVQGTPDVPFLLTHPQQAADAVEPKAAKAKDAVAPVNRDHQGRVFAGHKSFEWLAKVFEAVQSAQSALPADTYLWELIEAPKDKDGAVSKKLSGRYRVRLFVMGEWRAVTVDDRIPVDLFGQFLFVGMRPLQLWPLLLSKAVLKVMAAHRILGLNLPSQVTAFRLLTGWHQEDLLDTLGGTQLAGGFLFDRLEDAVRGNHAAKERHAIAAASLISRTLPEKPPPRVIVLAGPGGVGIASLLKRLVGDFPDKLGLTVSHTSRPPREHEVDGANYHFTDKAGFREEVAAGAFIEHAKVAGIHDTYLYGTSVAAVRTVAATGRLCLMTLDEQGVATLRANRRIDGLYLYVGCELGALEARLRARLTEDESTIGKRMAWAAAQIEAATRPNAYDHVVVNSEWDAVYLSLKEAISTLSPIIRNRLRGLPAYVLDYSDLIPPNLVEKPFLKPVVVAGPTTRERADLMCALVTEFPDVFAFPQLTTSKPSNEQDMFRVTASEQLAEFEEAQAKARRRIPGSTSNTTSSAMTPHGSMPVSPHKADHHRPGGALSPMPGPLIEETEEDMEAEAAAALYPEPIVMTDDEFDAAISNGELLEHHGDLFKHEMVTYRTGVSKAAIKQVIMDGKLPLLELENAGLEMLKASGVDCLSIFLNPPSLEVYRQRLDEWLTETDGDITLRMDMARKMAEGAGAFDHAIDNVDFDTAYITLKGLIARYRPEISVSVREEAAAEAGEERAPPPPEPTPIVVLAGPPGGGARELATALVAVFPDKFAAPSLLTDRKPAKGEASTLALEFVPAKEFAKMVTEGVFVLTYPGDGGTLAITKDTLTAIAARKMVAVIELPSPNLAAALHALGATGPLAGAAYVFVVAPPASSDDAAAGAVAEAGAAMLEAQGVDAWHSVIDARNEMDRLAAVRAVLTQRVPDFVPAPHKPLVVAGPFGTGKRVLLQRLFDALPSAFAVPVITTTRPAGEGNLDDRSDMEVVSADEAKVLIETGAFIVHEEAMGHVYGVTRGALKRVQASGRVPVLELDRVADAKALREAGFDAHFIYVGVASIDELIRRVKAEIASNPPLGYELDDASHRFFQAAKAEVAASREEGLFDNWVDNRHDAAAALTQLSEAVHTHYPEIVVKHFVWGYGRSLWDEGTRTYGEHALRVMVLGPAGSGKTMQAEMLSKHFGVPHINVGDLLYEEVKNKTALGLEAKVYMDSTKTVPDEYFIRILADRLLLPDCRSAGWCLDGFPHTEEQTQALVALGIVPDKTQALVALGIVPDKVLLLDATHAVLLDRTRHRRVDYDTMKTYHVPAKGVTNARSPAIEPTKPDGSPDDAATARLHPRHDDSEANVLARLKLWDVHAGALRAAYEDVSLRLGTDCDLQAPFQAAVDFLTLEARCPDVEVVHSAGLKELQYEVVDTMRYKRRQLLQLYELDPNDRVVTYWVDAKELASNAHCLLLCQDGESKWGAKAMQAHQQRRRANLAKAPRTLLITADNPEPTDIVISLDVGLQWALEDHPAVPRRAILLSGPMGSGKSTLSRMLLRDFPGKLAYVPPLTTAKPAKGETDDTPYTFLEVAELQEEVATGETTAQCEHAGAMYAVYVPALEAAWTDGKIALLEGPLVLGNAMKAALQGVDVAVVYLSADIETLDVRMRQADMVGEEELQRQLVVAAQEAKFVEAEAAEAARAATSPPSRRASTSGSAPPLLSGVPPLAPLSLPTVGRSVDHLIPAGGGAGVLDVYMRVRELAAMLWHRERLPLACQLVIEEFDWRTTAVAPTVKRMRCVLGACTTLSLPRGKHTLRVSANSELLHAVTFQSRSDFTANEYTEVMQEAEPSLAVACHEGEYERMDAGAVTLLHRYNVRVDAETSLAATLTVSGEDARAVTRLVLVDNSSGEETLVPLARLPATVLRPGAEGYTLLAIAEVPPAPALLPCRPGVLADPDPPAEAAAAPTAAKPSRMGGGAKPPSETGMVPAKPRGPPSLLTPQSGVRDNGSWILSVTSDSEPAAFEAMPVTRTQVVEGIYDPNSRCVLSRQLLVPMQPTQLALHARTTPPLPFSLTVMKVPAGTDVAWGTDYEVVLSRDAPDGIVTLHNVVLSPGKYVVATQLLGSLCPEGFQPSSVDGRVSGGGRIGWRCVYMPTTDAATCPIVADDARERYFKGVQDAWAAAAVAKASVAAAAAAAAGAAAAAAAAAPAVPAAKGGAKGAAPGGGGRKEAAAAALTRYLAQPQAGADGGGSAASGGPKGPPAAMAAVVRTLVDGSSLALTPDDAVMVVRPGAGSTGEVLSDEARTARLAATAGQGGSAVGGAPGGGLAGGLEQGKASRAALAARRQSEFSEWRSGGQAALKGAAKARADAGRAEPVA